MGEGAGAAVQSPYDNAGVGTGTMAPDGGGGENGDRLVPPPLHPLPRWGGEFLLLSVHIVRDKFSHLLRKNLSYCGVTDLYITQVQT